MNIDMLVDAAVPDVPALTRGRSMDAAARSACPALARLLARGDALEPPQMPIEHVLARCYGLPVGDAAGQAALMLLGEGREPESDYWMRADPVCLQPTKTHLALVPLAPDELTSAEAEGLGAALADHLAHAGYDLEMVHPQRWYLRCRTAPDLRTRAPHACAGLLDEAHLPAGADSARWRRLITEAQMLLHESPVNAAREAAGKLPANAIWPWGGGRLPRIDVSPYTRVYADAPHARGLARATNGVAALVPHEAIGVLENAMGSDSVLIVLDSGTDPARADLAALDSAWWAPLTAALAAGMIARLRIMLRLDAQRSYGRVVTRSHLRRWWRRTRDFAVHA